VSRVEEGEAFVRPHVIVTFRHPNTPLCNIFYRGEGYN